MTARVRMKNKRSVCLMLDSGVFTAWSRGLTLDLDDYISYLRDHQHLLDSHVNMDVIPGQFGQPRTQEQVNTSAEGSYRNQQALKDAGLSPIPVFHQGESFEWLERMIEEGEPYIGISTSKDVWPRAQDQWLDEVFSILTDGKGRPLVKTHGFGLMRPSSLLRYPFYSVDSTSWVIGAGVGKVLIPVYEKGEPNYLRVPFLVSMSGVQNKSGYKSKNHQFEGLGPQYRECITRFLADEVGITLAEARYGSTGRQKAWLVYYQRLGEHLWDIRFEHSHSRVVSQTDIDLSKWKFVGPWKVSMVFATDISRARSSLFNDVGAFDRLLSYFVLKDKPSKVLEDYVAYGINGKYRKPIPPPNWHSEIYRNYRRLNLARRVKEQEDAEKGPVGQVGDS